MSGRGVSDEEYMMCACTLHSVCIVGEVGAYTSSVYVQCRMEVDEVCTGSPVSMDGVVMDSVTSASYSALYYTICF